jgi:hypothetical protein
MHKYNLRELLDEFILEQAAQEIARSTAGKGLFQRFHFRQPRILSSPLLARLRHIHPTYRDPRKPGYGRKQTGFSTLNSDDCGRSI